MKIFGKEKTRLKSHGSAVVLAAAALLGAGSAMAQDAAPATDDSTVVVVTGVRASINRSLKLKRSADSIVDGVSAEDMGKFPDANVAEALQRIPGVAIDRQGGEGRFVSINGLGPEFASVLVNGRAVANDNPDRSFSFDTIAAELVSGVKVYKSANASIPEGGIGGTIDVITARPFDYRGFKFAGNVSALYEENSGATTPQASFIISNRFMDDKLGVLASFTRQERHSRTYGVQNSAIIHNLFFDQSAYAYVSDDLDEAWRMQDLSRNVVDEERTRTGGTLSVQYRPNDTWLFTADYLYSKFDVDTYTNQMMNWFWAVQDTDRNVIDSNGVYTTFDHGVGMPVAGYAYTRLEQYRPTTTQQFGFNTKWTPTDTFSGALDLSWSEAINDNRGLDKDYTLEALNQPGFLVHSDGGVPWIEDNGAFQPTEANEVKLRARQTQNSGTYVHSENWQAKADFDWTVNDAVSFDFGASYGNQMKHNEFWATPQAVRRLYHSNATNEVVDTSDIITEILHPGDVFGNSKLGGDMYVIDGTALRAWMADPVNLANRRNPTASLADFEANGRTWNAVKSGDSYQIDERDTSAYVDLHWATQLMSKPLSIVTGMRYSRTELTSQGAMRILTDLYQEMCGDHPCENSGILTPVYSSTDLTHIEAKHDYSYWLPSFNAKWDIADDMVLRLSLSQTMTRPTLENLAPQISYGRLFKEGRTAKGSNPNLKPFTSNNFDLSYEWYYQKDGALALAYFHKDVSDFIVELAGEETVSTIATPEYQSFLITRPRNAEEATIDGLTFGWTHSFENGLGFQANYTKVDSSVSKVAAAGSSFAVPGISDTANLVGFYEHGPFGARIAYNWRDAFMAQPNYGGTTEPRYYEPYHQIDARISWGFDSGTTIALDGVNLSNEKVLTHGRYENEFISYADYGRRVTLSVSQKF